MMSTLETTLALVDGNWLREQKVEAMEKSDNDRRIDYIELNVTDIARSKAFYGSAFGWTFKDYGPDYCEFGDGRLTGGFTTHGPTDAWRSAGDSLRRRPR